MLSVNESTNTQINKQTNQHVNTTFNFFNRKRILFKKYCNVLAQKLSYILCITMMTVQRAGYLSKESRITFFGWLVFMKTSYLLDKAFFYFKTSRSRIKGYEIIWE